MKDFISFVTSFCVVSAVIGGLSIIFPSGKLSKSVRYIAVLSLICAFIGIFFVKFNIDVHPDLSQIERSQNDTDIYLTKMIFENALKTNNITFSKIDFLTDKNESGSIIITKVFIYTSCSKEKIEEIIGNSSEYEVEVIDE